MLIQCRSNLDNTRVHCNLQMYRRTIGKNIAIFKKRNSRNSRSNDRSFQEREEPGDSLKIHSGEQNPSASDDPVPPSKMRVKIFLRHGY